MNIEIKQISDMEKIRSIKDFDVQRIEKQDILCGEKFCYQIAMYAERLQLFHITVNSPIKKYVKVYAVKKAVMDFPSNSFDDDDFITKESGLMPDMLVPLSEQNNCVSVSSEADTLWIEIAVPENFEPGEYPIDISFVNDETYRYGEMVQFVQTMKINVLPLNLPKQKTMFTQWFHVDCIAAVHNVKIYSEKHWALIEKYLKLAGDLGINTILTPVITPPLDTNFGTVRPCTQLVKIEKSGNRYSFDFSLLRRWISLCRNNGIEYYEISHLFSQWGLKYSPNIMVTENGKSRYMFGWNVLASDPSYKEFLKQFLPELIKVLKEEKIKDKCLFHLSDEPLENHMENYRYAHDLVRPLIDGCKIIDAMSSKIFYNEKLVDIPVSATDHIEPFIESDTKGLWAYYCCCQGNGVGNRFMAMPSYRNRILGLQIYKYGIGGFLQWGYNFYFSHRSFYPINPYVTTSGDKAFPSGDPFSVYPTQNGVTPSLRAVIFKEALQDIELCRMLEEKIGKEKVVELIEKEAGMEITFKDYPRNSEFIPHLMDKIKSMLI